MANATTGFKSNFKKTTILCSAVLFSASASEALALPVGGNVVGGNASIHSNGTRMDVNQSSQRAIINWKSFDIGGSEHVNFNQPSRNSVALNRVTGGQGASNIYGKLTANGNVVIVNPQGVTFHKGAQVNVGGLVATTSDVDNDDFMAGNYKFNKPGNADAAVINEGEITVGETGIAAFVAPNVKNSGVIEAKLGKVALASGDTFSVDLYGDGLIKLQASEKLKNQIVENSGKISANGGSVLLTTAAAESAVSSVINMDGIIEANSVGSKNGKVQLIGEKNSAGHATVLTGGKIEAKGNNAGEKGGNVEVLGNKVAVLKNATIDASGTNGGGSVLIGGEYLGQGTTPTASHAIVQEGATIKANATDTGNGGRVILWSDEYTLFDGVIEVLGGQNGGNGGFVETSSADNLQANGLVLAGAANGTGGTWLLDPRNVTIRSASTSGGNYSLGVFTPTSDNATVNVASIENTLNNGSNVTITTGNSGTQSGNITVDTDIEKFSGGNVTLVLNAAGSIILSNNVDIVSYNNRMNVELNAGNSITLGNNSLIDTNGGYANLYSGNTVTLGNNSDIRTYGGNVEIKGPNGVTFNNLAWVESGGGNILIQAGNGAVTLGSSTYVNSNRSQSSNDGSITIIGKAFRNSGGSDVLNAGSNNWLLYTVKASDNTYDGLTADYNRYSCTYGGSCPTLGNGNGFLYSSTPLLNLVINANPLTITYGSATPTFTYTLSGYQGSDANADTVTGSAGFSTNYTQGSNVGLYNITTTAGTLLSSLGYGFTGATLTNGLTVNPKQLTVSLTGNVNKVYDGNRNATISSGNYNIVGIYNNDNVSISNTAGLYADKNVANGKNVAVTGLTLTGTKSGNYTLASTSVNGNVGNITKRALMISAAGQNKTYDGNANATVTLSDNRVSGDTLTTGYTSATFNDKTAANGKTISVSGLNATGTDAGNYTWNTTASTFADIFKRALTISAAGQNKTYDGNANATVTLSDNRVSGDTLTTGYTSATFNDKTAANGKTISVSGLNATGTDAGNYTWNTTASTFADIFKRALTISATGQNKTYDGNANATVTLSDNRVSGDTLNTAYTSALFANKNAETGKVVTVTGITLAGADSGNYTWNTTATTLANIAKRALNIVASGQNKTYDGNADATVTLTDNRVSGDSLTTSYTSASFNNKNAGNGKAVSVSGLNASGTDAGNYTWNTTAGTTANILKRALTITATGGNKTYDGNIFTSVNLLDNRVAGDSLNTSYFLATFGNKNAGNGKTVSVSGINVTGADRNNYTWNSSTSLLANIAKRALTVTATALDKTYDGTTDASAILWDNRVIGDNLSSSYTSASFDNKNAGSGKVVTVSGIGISGSDVNNYTLQNTVATDTARINQRFLDIRAAGVNKTYDGTFDAAVTLSDDRISGDNLSTSYGSAFFLNKNAGNNRVITVLGVNVAGTDAGNYYYLPVNAATANIARRALTITAAANDKVYDGNTSATVTLTDDRVAGDNLNRSYTSANFDNKNAGVDKTVTVGGLAISGSDSGNYYVANAGLNATALADITQRVLTIGATGNNKVYDGATTATVNLNDNRVSGDVLSASYTNADFDNKNAGTGKTVTVTGLGISGTDAQNYTFNSSTTTTADITQRALNIGATASNKIYDGTAAATVTLSDDRVAGDNLNLAHDPAYFSDRNVGTAKLVTVDNITLGGNDSGNYTYNTIATANADITKRQLNVAADAKSKIYGDIDPSLTFTHDTLQTGDDASIFTGGLTRAAGQNVAGNPYAIALGNLSAGGNYDISFTGAGFIIDPASLTITANSQAIALGNSIPSLTYQVAGLKNGDTNSIFSGGLSTVSAQSLPGFYLINRGTLAANSNYIITYNPGVLAILGPGAQINTANQQALFGPLVTNIPSGNFGALLSIALSNSGGGFGGLNARALANLETAAGGEDNADAQNLGQLEPASGESIISLIDCNKTLFDSNPCQI